MTAIIVIFVLTFGYGYLNGLLASASVVAAAISSRALTARSAFWMAAVSMTLGPFLLGTAVASTIGSQLIAPQAATLPVISAGLIGAILWSSFTLWLKLPVSISQALIGGLIGAAWAGFGGQAIMASGLMKTLLGLFLSPPLGLLVGYLVVKFTYRLCINATPHINRRFRRAQIVFSLLMAISFSANDSQKMMGVLVLALIASGFLKEFTVPLWVVAFSAGAIGLGALVGSWRLIHTMGGKFYKIRPVHGFGAQFATDLVLFSAAILGGPVSGSQVVTSAIVGAGSADRLQKVRWGVLKNILVGWALTIPLSALVSAFGYGVIKGLAR
jgi:inorganic phosphate transporter, PiT family